MGVHAVLVQFKRKIAASATARSTLSDCRVLNPCTARNDMFAAAAGALEAAKSRELQLRDEAVHALDSAAAVEVRPVLKATSIG